MSDNNSTANTIPAEWTKTLQGEICRLGNGEKSQVAGFPYFEVKYLRGQKPKTLVNEGRFVLKDNKVIIVDGENSGEVFTIPENGYMGSTCKVLEINPKIDDKFLLYFIASKKQLYRNKKKGSAIPHLDKKLFAEMPFAYPKLLSEQQRIVAKIEELFSKLDAGIESLKKAKQQLAVYRQAVLKEAFSECAENEKITKYFDITGGLTKNSQREKFPRKMPYLRVANVYYNRLDLSEIKEIGVQETEIQQKLLQKDDLLFVEGNGSKEQIGRVAIWDGSIENCLHQNHIIKGRPFGNMLSKYALYYLISDFGRKQILSVSASTSGLYTLSTEKVRNLEILYRPLNEQLQIVSQIESRLTVCDKIERTVNESLEKADVLRQSILKKAFEGGL